MLNTIGRLGPFALEERLSGKAEGTVFRAVHVQGQRVLAVKFLSPEVVANSVATAAFTRQVGVLKTLQHRNVVCYYGGGKAGGQPYVAMELIHGQSLDRVIERGGALAWEAVVEIGLQLCAGLEFCHQRWIMHQQLRPSQVLWGEDGIIKIVGVGLVEFTATPIRSDKLIEVNGGDPAEAYYLAPEQISGGAITTRTDLYALGCVLYELLTGRPPFVADQADEVRQLHLNQAASRVVDIVFDCPVWLNAVVAQLLEKDPAARPAFASAVAVALRETKEHVAAGIGVTQHCLSRSAGALNMQQSKGEVRRLFGRRNRPKQSKVPFYERVWFLSACACLLLAMGIRALWPASEQKLFEQAAALMASDNRAEWRHARDEFIEPLLARFPNGQYASQVSEWIDQIEIDQAETKFKANQRIGRAPTTEAERLYSEAVRYEQFGDRQTARERYEAMLLSLSESGEDAPLIKLARRQTNRLSAEEKEADSRNRFLESKLDEADILAAEGNIVAARRIRQSVTTLYRDQLDLQSLVEKAQAGLTGKPATLEPEPSETSVMVEE